MPQPYMLVPPVGAEQADEWVRLGIETQMAAQVLPDATQRAAKFADAERQYRRALHLEPRHAIATQNLAVLFAQTGNLKEALLAIERAVMIDGGNPSLHCNRAYMNLEMDRYDEALAAARQAVAVSGPATDQPQDKASYVAARLALASLVPAAGLAEEAVPLYRELLAVEPGHGVAHANACFVQTLTDAGPADLESQREQWHQAHAYQGPREPHTNDKMPGRVLRVGYVGGDFKRHSAAMIFGRVVLDSNLYAFQQFLYSTLPTDPAADDLTKRFMTAGTWRDISVMNDEDAAGLIRRDQIDILVDLAAHTSGGRLALFTRKPAPVQVTAWGFAHGTGCPEIDYFFADPVAVPNHERQYFCERIVDLPCVVTYLEPKEYNLKGSSSLPYFQRDYLTFGAYARYEKLSAAYLAACGEILRRVPDSKIEFKDDAFRRPYSIRRVLAAMPAEIDPARLLFSVATNHPEHMISYQQVDLILNPFPHSGGLVSLEQLYMGVPFVTLYGTQAAGRTGACVLQAMGRKDWIAHTPAEYIEIAVRLANDLPLLNKVRRTLRDELLQSPVVRGYAEAVEKAYQAMWQRWCQPS